MAMNQKLTMQEIAGIIRAECAQIAMPYSNQVDAKKGLEDASTEVTNVRLNVCRTIARLAHQHDWDDAYLDDAVKLAQATPGNDPKTKKAVEVFCSQVKACARPRVRGQFHVIADAIKHAWAREKQEMETAKAAKTDYTPVLRKFVSREYEMVLRASREIHEGKTGLVIATVDHVFAWAIANDPDKDAERIAKRLKALAITLHEFFQEFPHAAINDAKQAIASVAAADLKAAADAKAKAEADRLAKMPLAPIPPVLQPAQPAQPKALEEAAAEQGAAHPAEGVFDVATLMNDQITALAIAA